MVQAPGRHEASVLGLRPLRHFPSGERNAAGLFLSKGTQVSIRGDRKRPGDMAEPRRQPCLRKAWVSPSFFFSESS